MENYVDVLRIDGVNAKGYGIVPKIIMKDSRLTPYAKLIYAYFCSYCGAGSNQAFPNRQTILKDLGISKDTFYKHFSLLKKYDYIRLEQKKGNGKFLYNIYTLVQCPNTIGSTENLTTEAFLPCPKSSDTVKPDTAKPPCPKSSDTMKPDTNNNIFGNNNNISPSTNTDILNNERVQERKEDHTNTLKANIDYDDLIDCYDGSAGMLDSIITLVSDVLHSPAPAYKIGGILVQSETVKERLLSLKKQHISWLLMALGNNTTPIYNMRNYLLTALFNSPITTGAERFIRAKQIANAIGN